jgi:hypothetical protein
MILGGTKLLSVFVPWELGTLIYPAAYLQKTKSSSSWLTCQSLGQSVLHGPMPIVTWEPASQPRRASELPCGLVPVAPQFPSPRWDGLRSYHADPHPWRLPDLVMAIRVRVSGTRRVLTRQGRVWGWFSTCKWHPYLTWTETDTGCVFSPTHRSPVGYLNLVHIKF